MTAMKTRRMATESGSPSSAGRDFKPNVSTLLAEKMEWPGDTDVTSGLCSTSVDPDIWFADDPDDIQLARTICMTCPIAETCFDVASARGEKYGVWGGRDMKVRH